MADNPNNVLAGVPNIDLSSNNILPSTAPINNPDSLQVAEKIQKDNSPQKVDLSQSLYGKKTTDTFWTPNIDTKPSLEKWNTNIDEAYTQLNDGSYITKFENYMQGSNNEDRLAGQQGFGEKLLNGVSKFGAKTLINVLDGTVGTVNGLVEGVKEGSLSAVYNNDFSKYVDDLNTKLDYKLPNYYSEQEKNNSLGVNLLTTNFWADKVLGGMSFVAGTVISEALWAAATGGSSLSMMGTKTALKEGLEVGARTAIKEQNSIMHSITKVMDAYQRTVPLNTTGKILNNARFLYTSAGYEAGVEARHYLKEAEANYIQAFSNANGRRPDGRELADFRDTATDTANGVFGANLALVGSSNIMQFGTLLGAGGFLETKGLQRSFNRALGIGIDKTAEAGKDIYTALKPNRLQRILGVTYNVAKSPFREGVYEEGLQNVFGNFGQRYLESQYNPNALQDNFDVIDNIEKSFAKTYGTKSGLEEVLIGSIIGFASPVLQGEGFGVKDYSQQLAKQDELVKYKTANSDFNLLQKIATTTSQKAFKDSAQKHFANDNAVLANQDLNMSLFAKLNVDNMMGLLDNSTENFKKTFEDLSPAQLAEQLNVSEEDAINAKELAIQAHVEAVDNFKKANRLAESILPDDSKDVIISTDEGNARIPNGSIQQMLSLNIYMANNSDKLARKYAEAVGDVLGDNSVTSALSLQNSLKEDEKVKVKQIDKLSKELESIDRAVRNRSNEFAKLAVKPRAGTTDSQLAALENRRQELLVAEEKDQQRKLEAEQELSTIASDIQKAVKARKVVNQDFGTLLSEDNITEERLKQTSVSLNSLKETLDLWKNTGQEAAAQEVEYLLSQFDQSVMSYKFANDTFNNLVDVNSRPKATKDIFGKIVSVAKKAKKDGDISDYEKASQVLYGELASQWQQKKALNNIFEDQKEELESTAQATEEVETASDKFPEAEDSQSSSNSLTIKDTLQNVINDLLKNRKEVENLNPSNLKDILPTESEQTEYKKLYERNRKSSNGLKPKDQIRFEELRQKLDNYGKAVGTINEDGVRLADILEQIQVLDDVEKIKESPSINDTHTEEINAKIVETNIERASAPAKTQNYDKSEYRQSENQNVSVTGINLHGFIDIALETAPFIQVFNNSGANIGKLTEKELTPEGYKIGDKFLIKINDVKIPVEIGQTYNLLFSKDAVDLINENTKLKIVPTENLPTNYQTLLKEIETPEGIELIPVDTNYELEPGVVFTDPSSLKDDERVRLIVSTKLEWNKALIKKYRAGKLKLEDLVRKINIYSMNDQNLVGIMKGINNSTELNESNANELYEIRKIAVQRALDSKLENEMVDVNIEIPVDKKGSYFGKPVYKIQYNKETKQAFSILQDFTNITQSKIKDAGYFEDGKLQLSDKVKDVNTLYVKKLPKGAKIPIIVFDYLGQNIAYPVSMKEVETNKLQKFEELIALPTPINKKVKDLNEFLAINGVDANLPDTGFYALGNQTNLNDLEHINRVRDTLSSEKDYNKFTQWTEIKNLKDLQQTVSAQSRINIDITNKPFHSAKLGLKLKEKIIIGDITEPKNEITEEIESDEIKMQVEKVINKEC